MGSARSRFQAGAPLPSLAGALRPGSRWFPVLALVCLASGSALAACALRWDWPLPFCVLRATTGLPCPACGCTRSLGAWAHLDPAGALRFNPLFALVCLGLAGWAALGLADLLLGTQRAPRLEALARRLCPVRVLLALAALNWLYLCFNLPK